MDRNHQMRRDRLRSDFAPQFDAVPLLRVEAALPILQIFETEFFFPPH